MGELTYTFIRWVESYNLRWFNQYTLRLWNEQLEQTLENKSRSLSYLCVCF